MVGVGRRPRFGILSVEALKCTAEWASVELGVWYGRIEFNLTINYDFETCHGLCVFKIGMVDVSCFSEDLNDSNLFRNADNRLLPAR